MSDDASGDPLEDARQTFVRSWGALGTSWGVSRTMAMIHALLLVSDVPLSTDEVMAELGASRGNANTNLRELVGWGLVRRVIVEGERREYFEAEKDVWTIFCTIARERKRREIEPALALLESCLAGTKGLRSAKAKAFHKQLTELAQFVQTANSVLERISASEQSKVIPAILKWLK
ncbi:TRANSCRIPTIONAL REGULATOR, ARSR family protein [Enhygromyxa salina]|uniref:HTH-type transcriptional regulator n=1 Tax=Enhygromyxa salina TaxID=215803 RepID=A0A0C2DCX4_9BACT|nr:transcriptional regulator [Enhygromyxa salina]KIG19255.1 TRANSCRIPTIONAL REGULATOR, ARSR family protein [Enhygromyxa salina]